MVRPAFATVALVNSVGNLIQPKTSGNQAGITLNDDWTIDQALAHLRSLSPAAGSGMGSSQVMDFFVLDAEGRLVGLITPRQLLFSDPTTPLSSIMGTSMVSLKDTDSLLTACELFAKYRLMAIPVLTADRKFLGTLDVSVYTEEKQDFTAPKATDDVFQLIGVHLEHAKNASPFAGYKLRMPWLLANISGGLICAVLASVFDRVLSEIILMAAFIPVMLALSESISIQAMTLSIQSGESKSLRRAIFRELSTSFLLGISSGLFVLLVALLWRKPFTQPLVIGGCIAVNMLLSAAIGLLLPKFVAKLRLNPNIASGPLVLASADMVSITIYLATGTAVLLEAHKMVSP